jgi:hypothetical protein
MLSIKARKRPIASPTMQNLQNFDTTIPTRICSQSPTDTTGKHHSHGSCAVDPLFDDGGFDEFDQREHTSCAMGNSSKAFYISCNALSLLPATISPIHRAFYLPLLPALSLPNNA